MDNLNAITIAQNIAARTLFQIAGAYFRLVSMSGAGTMTVELLRSGRVVGSLSGFLAGLAVDATDFDAVALTPSAASDVEFVIADSAVRYDRFTGDVSVSNLPAINGAMTRAVVAAQDAITASELYAANAARRALLVQNCSTSVYVRLRVDGVNPTTAAGLRIPPGGSYEAPAGFAPTGAVAVIAESGTAAIEALEG